GPPGAETHGWGPARADASPPSAHTDAGHPTFATLAAASLPGRRFELQEARGVIMEDRPLLRRGEEGRAVHALHREGDRLGPDHLVGAEHQAVAQARGQQGLEVVVELLPRNDPV